MLNYWLFEYESFLFINERERVEMNLYWYMLYIFL